MAVEEAGVVTAPQLAVDAEVALALADERLLEAAADDRQLVERRPLADRRHAGVDDLDRIAVGAAVLALVQPVELLERESREGARRA